MSQSNLADEFIISYLDQLKYEDFSSIMNKINHTFRYTSVVGVNYLVKNYKLMYDAIRKMDGQEKNNFIKHIMHYHTGRTTKIIENDFLDKINFDKCVPFIDSSIIIKCINQNPTILSLILQQPNDIQKAIIEVNTWTMLENFIKENPKIVINQLLTDKAFSSDLAQLIFAEVHTEDNNTPIESPIKDDTKDEFIIVSKKQDDQSLEEMIDKEAEKILENEKELWDKKSITALTNIYSELIGIYSEFIYHVNSQCMHNRINLSIKLRVMDEYINLRQENELKKEKELKEEKKLWDTLSLSELNVMYNKALNWKDKGAGALCGKENELKLLRMSQYIGHKSIEERYK